MDEFDDDQLGAALRRRSDTLPVGDVAAVGEAVRRRGRRRRVTRSVLAGAGAVLLVGAGVLVVASRNEEVVRSPATSPTVSAVQTVPSTDPSPAPTADTVPASPAPTIAPVSPEPLPTAGAVVGTSVPLVESPATEFTSLGGSIVVDRTGDVIRLFGEPQPSPGYEVEIEDDGPDRVRVRFESGDLRSRITVELVDGELLPQIVED